MFVPICDLAIFLQNERKIHENHRFYARVLCVCSTTKGPPMAVLYPQLEFASPFNASAPEAARQCCEPIPLCKQSGDGFEGGCHDKGTAYGSPFVMAPATGIEPITTP